MAGRHLQWDKGAECLEGRECQRHLWFVVVVLVVLRLLRVETLRQSLVGMGLDGQGLGNREHLTGGKSRSEEWGVGSGMVRQHDVLSRTWGEVGDDECEGLQT